MKTATPARRSTPSSSRNTRPVSETLLVTPLTSRTSYYYQASRTRGPKSSTRSTPNCSRPLKEREIPAGVQKPLRRRRRARSQVGCVAVDAVFDSVSVGSRRSRKTRRRHGVIFCRSPRRCEAPGAGAQVPRNRGCRQPTTSSPRSTRRCSPTARSSSSPKGVTCPMELSTYFRINERHRPVRAHADHRRGGRRASATSRAAPRRMRDENQLHRRGGRADRARR